jgi:hypothetical protein
MYVRALGWQWGIIERNRTRVVVNFMATLLDMLFGCWHKNISFPITKRPGQRRSPAASLTGTYVVCLDCGKEFAYDWKEMKIIDGPARRNKAMAAKAAESYAGKSEAA